MANKITISYNLNTFMQYKDVNHYIHPNFESLCLSSGGNLILRESILKETSIVIDSFMNGKNPNDMILKNNIIENLNKLSDKNFSQVLECLGNISYQKPEHFETLTIDILTRVMTDAIAIRFDINVANKCQSELLGDVVVAFSNLSITNEELNQVIKFNSLFISFCKKYFTDFIDVSKPLDSNNPSRVENFKGFMNFMGILYKKKVLSTDAILECLNKLRDLMFNKDWGKVESLNVLEGYIKFIGHIGQYFEKKSSFSSPDVKNTVIKQLENIISVNKTIKTYNDIHSKFKGYVMLCHNDIDKKLNNTLNILTHK